MALKWTDTLDIAEALIETYPEQDPTQLNFVDLMKWVMSLPQFDDDPKRCGERVLEAIQQTWIDER